MTSIKRDYAVIFYDTSRKILTGSRYYLGCKNMCSRKQLSEARSSLKPCGEMQLSLERLTSNDDRTPNWNSSYYPHKSLSLLYTLISIVVSKLIALIFVCNTVLVTEPVSFSFSVSFAICETTESITGTVIVLVLKP